MTVCATLPPRYLELEQIVAWQHTKLFPKVIFVSTVEAKFADTRTNFDNVPCAYAFASIVNIITTHPRYPPRLAKCSDAVRNV